MRRRRAGPGWRSDSRFLSAAADDTTSQVLVTRGVLEEPNTNRRSRLQKDSGGRPFLGHMSLSAIDQVSTSSCLFTTTKVIILLLLWQV